MELITKLIVEVYQDELEMVIIHKNLNTVEPPSSKDLLLKLTLKPRIKETSCLFFPIVMHCSVTQQQDMYVWTHH